MIVSGLHEDLDSPPSILMITGTAKQDSLTEAPTSVATVFAKMINTPSTSHSAAASSSTVGMSPCKAADFRIKHLEQLRCLQQLMEDNIIPESEFKEQKEIIATL